MFMLANTLLCCDTIGLTLLSNQHPHHHDEDDEEEMTDEDEEDQVEEDESDEDVICSTALITIYLCLVYRVMIIRRRKLQLPWR